MLLLSSCSSSSPSALAPVRAVASRRSRARAVHRTCAAADDSASEREKIYIGKGRVVSDDPKKYPGRDAGGLVGGWAGGEKELKDWAAVPFSPIDPALRKAMNDFSDKKEEAESSEREGIYVGKGRFVKGDPRQFPDKELGGLTGGWAGGELGLKVDSSKFAPETRVRVKGTLQPWMNNPLFARSNMAQAGKVGVVSSCRIDGGSLKVAVRLQGEPPAGVPADESVEWTRLMVFSDNELEVI